MCVCVCVCVCVLYIYMMKHVLKMLFFFCWYVFNYFLSNLKFKQPSNGSIINCPFIVYLYLSNGCKLFKLSFIQYFAILGRKFNKLPLIVSEFDRGSGLSKWQENFEIVFHMAHYIKKCHWHGYYTNELMSSMNEMNKLWFARENHKNWSQTWFQHKNWLV